MQLQDGLELSWEHVLLACVQVSAEICMVPQENILYLQRNRNSVTECLASSMGVCSQKSFHCVGAGLFSRLMSLLVCKPVLAACGHVHSVLEVHLMKYFALEVCVHGLNLPALLSLLLVVLKGVSISGTVGTILELYRHCTDLQFFHMSCRIWKMLDIPSSVPLTVPFPMLA